MAISLKAVGSYIDLVSESTVVIPGSPSAGDRMFLFATNKDYSNTIGVSSGWTQIGSQYADGVVGAGSGSGSMAIHSWYRDWVSGDANPTVTPTPDASDGGAAVIQVWQKDTGDIWDTPLTTEADWTLNAAATPQTVSANDTVSVPDESVVIAFLGICDDTATISRPTSGIDVASGITWDGDYVESPGTHFSSSSGFDASADLGYRLVSVGGSVTLRTTATVVTAETGAVKFVVQSLVPPGMTASQVLRPIAGLDTDSGNSTWQSIDDVVTQPDSPGDLSYASYSGASAATIVEKFKVAAPSLGNTITHARLWVLAHANIDGTMSVFTVRIKISGTWYDIGLVNDPLTTSPQWFYYEVSGITESSDSDDIGFELGINESTGTPGQAAKIDVAYMEVTYEETIPGEYAGAGSVIGADEFYGVGGRTFEGYGSLSGTGEFSGTGLQPASGYGWVLGEDSFSGVGRVPDSGYGPVTGTGYFYGVGRLPDSGYGSVSGAGVLSGTGSVPASSAVVRLRRAGIMAEW